MSDIYLLAAPAMGIMMRPILEATLEISFWAFLTPIILWILRMSVKHLKLYLFGNLKVKRVQFFFCQNSFGPPLSLLAPIYLLRVPPLIIWLLGGLAPWMILFCKPEQQASKNRLSGLLQYISLATWMIPFRKQQGLQNTVIPTTNPLNHLN